MSATTMPVPTAALKRNAKALIHRGNLGACAGASTARRAHSEFDFRTHDRNPVACSASGAEHALAHLAALLSLDG
jgi:hypothetical protein